MRIPQKCINLRGLAVVGFGRPLTSDIPPRTDNDFWSCPTLRPSHVTVYQADCRLFQDYSLPAPLALRNCTHLSLQHLETDLAPASHLLTLLPTVTHLAFYYFLPHLFQIRNLKSICRKDNGLQLILLVHFIPPKFWHTFVDLYGTSPMSQPHFKSKWERKDRRIALLNIQSPKSAIYHVWGRNATGSEDIWELGRRRLQDIA
ncbi:hypothetical protein SISSUDRAFT_1101886 [Sistotremastrum suecicum HHB10207 ss-3]|uniref:F-box domain-containing protein n=1 Tax=Sistotremastrum suecicum HHB10207 ss-3 TaxID=1314776 RepID=A0A165WRQ8_9AGAM|nr:hypothetical protein SISSUDRAFT_1101886 [Sistotremastrum suecicum HHB10207 ss-3]